MSFLGHIGRLVKDPPPTHAFELSEAGIAFARGVGHAAELGFEPLEPGVLTVTPLADNVQNSEAITARLERLLPRNGTRKRRQVALVLPDYMARVTVLDFDSFPSASEDQISLVRFRVRKSVPYDIDSAAISYWVQASRGRSKEIDVVVATASLEIVARYEALFRHLNCQPGMVITSALAALSLYKENGVNISAKLSGRFLTVMVLDGAALRLIRSVELEQASPEEILGVLHPTLSYVEDELSSPAQKLFHCGFGPNPEWLRQIPLAAEPLRSRFGIPGPYDAGLLGYLESVEV